MKRNKTTREPKLKRRNQEQQNKTNPGTEKYNQYQYNGGTEKRDQESGH